MAYNYQPQDLKVIGLIHVCNTFSVTCPALKTMQQTDYIFNPFDVCRCPFYVSEEGTCVSELYQKGLGSNVKT